MMVKRFGKNLMVAVKIIAAVLMCVYMWGCGDTYYDWEDRRSSRRVVGFVDDSLVMVGDIRCWTKYEETILAMSDEDLGSGCGHTRLCVYNYRVQEDGPRWCDSLDNTRDESTLIGQMTDSIVWGGNVPESIKMWKLGEKPHERKLRKIVEGCSVAFNDYSGAAEPPVRKNGSHHSRPREPPIYSSFVWSNSACCCRAGFHKPVRASRLPTSSLEAHAML